MCPALPLAVPQVNLLIPVAYLVFWAFLLVFSFISEPMVCGVGVIIIPSRGARFSSWEHSGEANQSVCTDSQVS